ncbi:polypeptide N-acetylgalactosaminyltransferase-like 6 [Phasianus colchicus]|nr:polypeptide N-acetylgalactosaminyltransferase-like 6 [Phasianus colchicus]
MEPGCTPPKPHLRTECHWGRVSFWRSLLCGVFPVNLGLQVQTVPLGLGDGQLFTWTDGLKRKDWHDYESIQKDAMRSGKGEHGKPYPLTEEDHDDSAYRENGFNIFVSNNIALERSLPDIRHPNCKHKVYLEKLPNTSIIIPFHNEGWTSLLRTIHSIINRTPDSLIAEIILVDDFSDRGKAQMALFYLKVFMKPGSC